MLPDAVEYCRATQYSSHKLLAQYQNCLVVRNGTLKREDLWVENGLICDPEKLFYDGRRSADVRFDCRGLILSPGFIDVQINGGFGVDFSSFRDANFDDSLLYFRRECLSHGVTSFCPTLISSTSCYYARVLPKIKRCNGSKSGAGILGVHLEGPFITKPGCHRLENLRTDFNLPGVLRQVYGTDTFENVSIVTIAPEVPGAADITRQLSARGVVVSLGHSGASLAEAETAVRAGACGLTHLFNAMVSFNHRDPGIIGLLASDVPSSRFFYSMICDGLHSEPAAIRIAYKSRPDGFILVTDANAGLGCAEGTTNLNLGDIQVEIKGGRAVVAGTDTLAGAIASMQHCIVTMQRAARCSLVEAIECATLHPAQYLGVESRKGTLAYGSDADFVLLDNESLDVKATFIAGEMVYCSDLKKFDSAFSQVS